ncbi:hypothetical protein CONPUDRAFT_71128 [Coniophora puteana RWD-64-598 SS2]|uniref:Uncharacterized protein n=1 Tax=Coniophora puteana (strain RWD-64-598) TaxID=741705 RepID=A0A5M3MZU7_CONPW|nr:uncharacterized protein CONPUDRAFT_71128 [Coniophora puteana RWD-64-598 SS2]EIW84334.1 hypothetical protein CONPUDRAFT_71128 [Coniophora puteana RWD-64-598 SS2]
MNYRACHTHRSRPYPKFLLAPSALEQNKYSSMPTDELLSKLRLGRMDWSAIEDIASPQIDEKLRPNLPLHDQDSDLIDDIVRSLWYLLQSEPPFQTSIRVPVLVHYAKGWPVKIFIARYLHENRMRVHSAEHKDFMGHFLANVCTRNLLRYRNHLKDVGISKRDDISTLRSLTESGVETYEKWKDTVCMSPLEWEVLISAAVTSG